MTFHESQPLIWVSRHVLDDISRSTSTHLGIETRSQRHFTKHKHSFAYRYTRSMTFHESQPLIWVSRHVLDNISRSTSSHLGIETRSRRHFTKHKQSFGYRDTFSTTFHESQALIWVSIHALDDISRSASTHLSIDTRSRRHFTKRKHSFGYRDMFSMTFRETQAVIWVSRRERLSSPKADQY